MEAFTNLMYGVNSIVWCMALVALCLGAGPGVHGHSYAVHEWI